MRSCGLSTAIASATTSRDLASPLYIAYILSVSFTPAASSSLTILGIALSRIVFSCGVISAISSASRWARSWRRVSIRSCVVRSSRVSIMRAALSMRPTCISSIALVIDTTCSSVKPSLCISSCRSASDCSRCSMDISEATPDLINSPDNSISTILPGSPCSIVSTASGFETPASSRMFSLSCVFFVR